jgi:hypothetical protein
LTGEHDARKNASQAARLKYLLIREWAATGSGLRLTSVHFDAIHKGRKCRSFNWRCGGDTG